MECGDNWSEQNDPVHLLETWERLIAPKNGTAGKFHTLDFDFIEALEYGMPPTTGIGPGVERMAMIFTGQENIDDVIFFPMMRPSISPLNASIYGVQEATLAPVEDLALSFEDFESLCDDGVLKPHARNLTVKPHVRLWRSQPRLGGRAPPATSRLKVSCRIACCGCPATEIKSEESLSEDVEKKKVLDLLELSLVKFLRDKFPECQVTMSPATVMRHA